MHVVHITLPKEQEEVELHIFADLHIGDVHTNLDDIKARIERVKNTPNAYALLNGDLMNNATKTSVSDSYAEVYSPMEQVERLVTLFTPIKDRILGVTQGNHENRTYVKEGIDLTALLCRELGILDRYSKTGLVIFLKVGQYRSHRTRWIPVNYCIYMLHGSGGGRKEGAKAIRLADMGTIIDADIYIHSHTHLPMIMKQAYHRTDMSNGVVRLVDRLFVNTSASMTYGGYGEAFEFKPNSIQTPVIKLSGKTKAFTAKL